MNWRNFVCGLICGDAIALAKRQQLRISVLEQQTQVLREKLEGEIYAQPSVCYNKPAIEIYDRLEKVCAQLWWMDNTYWFTDKDSWVAIAKRLMTDMSYQTEIFDCDDFAFSFKSLCAIHYGLNGCAIVLGNTPMGYHAWNLVVCPDIVFYLEPQTRDIWLPDEKPGYQPDNIII